MLVALLIASACSEKKPASRDEPPKPEPTPAGSGSAAAAKPPPPADSGSATATSGSATAGSATAGSASAASGPGAAWTAAWKSAMDAPPAGAPRNKDWPCSATSDTGASFEWTYGGPAKCVTPPDEMLVGCPISVIKKDNGQLSDERKFAYDADGQLVAIHSKKRDKERHIRVSYASGKPASGEMDSNGDGIVDARTRFTYTKDKILQENDPEAKGTYERANEFTLKSGKVVGDAATMTTSRFNWKGNRLITREVMIGGQVQGTVKYKYDCK
jgi:hypothetical protein